jgi:transposase
MTAPAFGIGVPGWVVETTQCMEPTTMQTTTIGLDLAKNVFQVHGVDARERAVLRKRLPRTKVLEFFAQLPPCRIGMEACPGAHWWARQLLRLGHDVRLMPPQYVRPYVKRNKNDAADAEAICEALTWIIHERQRAWLCGRA